MAVLAWLLAWLDNAERVPELRSMIRVRAERAFHLLEEFPNRPTEEQENIRAYLFATMLRGARANDAFLGLCSGKKSLFGSVRTELAKDQKRLQTALDELRASQSEAQAADPSILVNPSIARTEGQLKWLERAAAFTQQLESEQSCRPLEPLLSMLPENGTLRKLVIEAAFQKLLGHFELVELWHQRVYEFELKKQQTEKTEEYRRYLEFCGKNSQFIDELRNAPRNPSVYARYLRDPRIRLFFGDGTADEALSGLMADGLRTSSPAIAWFDKQHKLRMLINRGPDSAPTLTFIQAQEHPFHFTLPGPRTAKGWYALQQSADSAVVELRCLTADGTWQSAVLPFSARSEIEAFVERDVQAADAEGKKSSSKQWYFAPPGGKERRLWFGGLRIRPSRKNPDLLFLDLIVNFEGDEPSEAAQAVEFDTESATFKIPNGALACSLVTADDGRLWLVRKRREGGKWRHCSSSEVTFRDQRWPKLPPVTISNEPENSRRTVEAWEFGVLYGMLQHQLAHRQPKQSNAALAAKLASAVAGSDGETLQVLRQHLVQRNQRAQTPHPPQERLCGFGVGTLRELDLRIRRLVSQLARLRNAARDLEKGSEAFKANRREKTACIRQLKTARRHSLNCRKSRIALATAAVTEAALGSGGRYPKADMFVLPAKPPKDKNYQRSKSGRPTVENQLLAICRTGELCDRIVSEMELQGIRTLRAITAKTDAVCPRCGAPSGILFINTVDPASGKTVIGLSKKSKPKSRNKDKGGKTQRSVPPLPKPRRFGCPDCKFQADALHVIGQNMLARLTDGRAYGTLPEGKSKLTPKAALAALQK
jgi:hypothetical protein